MRRVWKFIAALALILAAGSWFLSALLYSNIQDEARGRRDQSCKRDESAHLDDVKQLRQTYRYLKQLRPEERKQTINLFIVKNLPKQEREARVDSAPAFCDEPGAKAEARGEPPIGLPEPDPKIPKRPPGL